MAEAELTTWMAAHVEGFRGPLTLTRLAGGQSNPTWRVDAASGPYVLRQKPLGKVLPSAHQVDREFRVMQALADTDVPVPHVYALCKDDAVMGSMFFVMEFLDGRTLFNPQLPDLAPSERAGIFDAMNGAIAAISLVDPNAVGLGDYGRQGGYIERQVSRWSKQYRASETKVIPAMNSLIDWLPQNMPTAPEEVRLAHGDFRLDNMIIHPEEPRVIAVLDWEICTLGDPLADVGLLQVYWNGPNDDAGAWNGTSTSAPGFWDRRQLAERYAEVSGRDISHLDFYVAFAFWKLACIIEGVYSRYLGGALGDRPPEELAPFKLQVEQAAATAEKYLDALA